MASTCVSHDALNTGPTPSHDLAFFDPSEASTLERAPAIRGLLYKGNGQQRPQRDNAHVKWDEQCIAEHDKERGTRQKIDEPDTPFVRSPENSDSEDDASAPACSSTARAREGEAAAGTAQMKEDETRAATSSDPMAMLTNRLEQWVESGGRRDSRSSGSDGEAAAPSEASRHETKSVPSISLPEDAGPRASSSEFKDKRAKHYNEFAAMKAFNKKKTTNSESSADSDTSDEAAAAAKKERKARQTQRQAQQGRQMSDPGQAAGKGTGGAGSRAGGCEGETQESSSSAPGEERKASFVPVPAEARRPDRTLPNPMEGGRPPVHFGEETQDSVAAKNSSLSSSEFLAQRRAHYDEGVALRSKDASLAQDEASPVRAEGASGESAKTTAANPMDATEAQETVSFKVETLVGKGQGGDDEWRSKRNAHYRDMAAAFRSMPPVSDSESEGDGA